MIFPKSGNKIWYNRSVFYSDLIKSDIIFKKELDFIMNEIGNQ